LLLASGASSVAIQSAKKQFEDALKNVCRSLAAQIVSDGEGVKHVVRLKSEQSRNTDEARRIARSVANSPPAPITWAQ